MEFTTGFELQSQATRLRWTAFTRRRSEGKTGLSPSPVPCSKGINPGSPPGTPGTTPRRDWQHGLFPLQSPLLRESWLVSFPPLNYMLKFSGSSCVHQVQGKVSWGTLSVRRRRRFGEVEGGFQKGTHAHARGPAESLRAWPTNKKEASRWRWCLVTDLPHPRRTIHTCRERFRHQTTRLVRRSTLRGMPVSCPKTKHRQRPDSTAPTPTRSIPRNRAAQQGG